MYVSQVFKLLTFLISKLQVATVIHCNMFCAHLMVGLLFKNRTIPENPSIIFLCMQVYPENPDFTNIS